MSCKSKENWIGMCAQWGKAKKFSNCYLRKKLKCLLEGLRTVSIADNIDFIIDIKDSFHLVLLLVCFAPDKRGPHPYPQDFEFKYVFPSSMCHRINIKIYLFQRFTGNVSFVVRLFPILLRLQFFKRRDNAITIIIIMISSSSSSSLLYNCIIVSSYRCIIVLLYHRIIVSWHHVHNSALGAVSDKVDKHKVAKVSLNVCLTLHRDKAKLQTKTRQLDFAFVLRWKSYLFSAAVCIFSSCNLYFFSFNLHLFVLKIICFQRQFAFFSSCNLYFSVGWIRICFEVQWWLFVHFVFLFLHFSSSIFVHFVLFCVILSFCTFCVYFCIFVIYICSVGWIYICFEVQWEQFVHFVALGLVCKILWPLVSQQFDMVMRKMMMMMNMIMVVMMVVMMVMMVMMVVCNALTWF